MDTLSAASLLKILRNHTPDPAKPIDQLRHEFQEFYGQFQSSDITPTKVNIGDFCCYSIEPKTITQPYVILFMHGGGFTMGSTGDHIGMLSRLANLTEASILSVDYHLSPEYTFPKALNDCVESYLYLLASGYKAKDIIPMGISAGGTLVLTLLLKLRDENRQLPKLACCLSPAVSLLFEGESTITNQHNDWITKARLNSIKTIYLKSEEDPKAPLISPLYADLKGLCDLYIQFGDHELLRDDILAFISKAREELVHVQVDLWKNMFHCWQIFSNVLPEGEEALKKMCSYIQKNVK